MRRLLLTAPILVLLLAPAVAPAAYERSGLRVAEPVSQSCLRELPPGTAGTDGIRWTAPAAGYLDARLSGGLSGDWDLALIDRRSGATRAVSTGFGSNEQATLWVERGETLAVQACRREGGGERVPLSIDL